MRLYAPSVATQRIAPYSSGFGIFQHWHPEADQQEVQKRAAARLPTYRLAISAPTRLAWVWNSSGPGWMP